VKVLDQLRDDHRATKYYRFHARNFLRDEVHKGKPNARETFDRYFDWYDAVDALNTTGIPAVPQQEEDM